MLFRRLFFLPVFSLALFLTAAGNVRAEQSGFDRQIAERAKQYQETLRQRTAQVAPSLKQKVESQTRQTVNNGLGNLKAGRISLRVALPQWHAAREIARFIAKYVPFSGFPSSFGFGTGTAAPALTVPAGQHHVKNHSANVAGTAVQNAHSARPVSQTGNILAYYVRVVRTVVLRN
jgi:hypothetical protein